VIDTPSDARPDTADERRDPLTGWSIAAKNRTVEAIRESRSFWSDVEATRSRLASLGVSGVYLLLGGWLMGMEGLLRTLTFLIVPLCCIWFGEAMGMAISGRITKKTPGSVVEVGGWIGLLSPILAGLFAALAAGG
jgi:hypothetical protein